jgi:transketolase
MPLISPLDEEEVENILKKYKKIFVVEEHFEEGGLGSILSDFAMKKKINADIDKIAIKNHYIHEIGSCNYLREKLGVDAKAIIQKVKNG